MWDATGQAHIRYEAGDVGQDAIAHVVENNRLVAAAVGQLKGGTLYTSPAGSQLAGGRGGGVTLLAPKTLASLELPSATDPREPAGLSSLLLNSIIKQWTAGSLASLELPSATDPREVALPFELANELCYNKSIDTPGAQDACQSGAAQCSTAPVRLPGLSSLLPNSCYNHNQAMDGR